MTPSLDSSTRLNGESIWITIDIDNHSLCGYRCPKIESNGKLGNSEKFHCKAFDLPLETYTRQDGVKVSQRLAICQLGEPR